MEIKTSEMKAASSIIPTTSSSAGQEHYEKYISRYNTLDRNRLDKLTELYESIKEPQFHYPAAAVRETVPDLDKLARVLQLYEQIQDRSVIADAIERSTKEHPLPSALHPANLSIQTDNRAAEHEHAHDGKSTSLSQLKQYLQKSTTLRRLASALQHVLLPNDLNSTEKPVAKPKKSAKNSSSDEEEDEEDGRNVHDQSESSDDAGSEGPSSGSQSGNEVSSEDTEEDTRTHANQRDRNKNRKTDNVSPLSPAAPSPLPTRGKDTQTVPTRSDSDIESDSGSSPRKSPVPPTKNVSSALPLPRANPENKELGTWRLRHRLERELPGDVKNTNAPSRVAPVGAPTTHAATLQSVIHQGAVFLKYGKTGKPHYKHVIVTPSGYLLWGETPRETLGMQVNVAAKIDPFDMGDSSKHLSCDGDDENDEDLDMVTKPPKNRIRISQTIQLKDITAILKGKQTAVFRRKVASQAPSDHCFSIITSARSLDLQASNRGQRDLWVAALGSAVSVINRRLMVSKPSGQYDLAADIELLKGTAIGRGRQGATLPPILDQGTIRRILDFLSKGEQLTKHGRSGNPHLKWISCSQGRIYWVTGTFRSDLTFLELKEVKSIEVGKKTTVFHRIECKDIPDEKCFSLVLPDRTFDLEARDQKQRDHWVVALRLAVQLAKDGLHQYSSQTLNRSRVLSGDAAADPGWQRSATGARSATFKNAHGVHSASNTLSRDIRQQRGVPRMAGTLNAASSRTDQLQRLLADDFERAASAYTATGTLKRSESDRVAKNAAENRAHRHPGLGDRTFVDPDGIELPDPTMPSYSHMRASSGSKLDNDAPPASLDPETVRRYRASVRRRASMIGGFHHLKNRAGFEERVSPESPWQDAATESATVNLSELDLTARPDQMRTKSEPTEEIDDDDVLASLDLTALSMEEWVNITQSLAKSGEIVEEKR